MGFWGIHSDPTLRQNDLNSLSRNPGSASEIYKDDHFMVYVVGAQKNHLIETALLRTLNIC